jgi:hypothetical protein
VARSSGLSPKSEEAAARCSSDNADAADVEPKVAAPLILVATELE